MLLIGRDLPSAHHVIDQRIGDENAPYAQRLNLGWVVVGEVCLGTIHNVNGINVNKTYVTCDGRPTVFQLCPNRISLKETYKDIDTIGSEVFIKSRDHDKPGTSVEDRLFVELMEQKMIKNSNGHWTAPLPFRPERPRLPNNKVQALKRAKLLDHSLKNNQLKKEHMVKFMQEILDKGYAQQAPPLDDKEECWYLPLFGMYHPKKPTQIRGVFDSSAQFKGVSLNKVLMSGPDLTNNLLGILMRFRKDSIAVTGDFEKMFYQFEVDKDHRNFLRFFWYDNNDPTKQLIEYGMCVHVFGNTPS